MDEDKVHRIEFPMNQFLAALIKMKPAQRAKADPQKAADKYGLKLEVTTYWIEHYRRHD